MKKNILHLAVLVAALACTTAAQAQLKFGVKAGLNVSSVSMKDIPGNFDNSNRTGFFAGATADVTIPFVGIGADVSLMYDNRVVNVTAVAGGEKESANKTLHYIVLPVNVKYTLGFSSLVSAYAATGPQFAWNIGDRHWGNVTEGWELKSSAFSWNVGVGATFLSHVRIGYNYNIGLGNTAELSGWGVAGKAIKGKLKNNTHQIALTYLF